MSRPPLPSPPLSSLPLSEILKIAKTDIEPPGSLSLVTCFERVKYEADKGLIAERKGKKEEMFVAYTRACLYYNNCLQYPDYKEGKDKALVHRIKDFKDTFEVYKTKAFNTKADLQSRPIEAGNQPPAPLQPETSSMGSIADRMKALSGKGMNVGLQTKRMSKDMGPPPSPSTSAAGSSKNGQIGGMSITGGAGNFGPARYAKGGSDVRALPNRPSSPPKESPAVKQTITGSSTRSVDTNHQPPPQDRPPPVQTKPDALASSGSGPRLESTDTPQAESSIRPIAPAYSGPKSYSNESSRPSDSGHPIAPTNPGTKSFTYDSSRPPDQPTRPIAPTYSGPKSLEPLRPDPVRPVHPPRSPSHPAPPEPIDDLDKFANAFPSVSEFGKQFENDEASFVAQNGHSYPFEKTTPSGLPNGYSHPTIREGPEPSFPELPLFPVLPSVPTSRPGLSAPPKGFSPPSPDIRNVARPTSAPAPTEKDLLSSSPISEIPKSTLRQPPDPPQQSPLAFPMPVPTPHVNGKSHSIPSQTEKDVPYFEKPVFPRTNAIDPDTLRSYFINPTVDMLIVDIRSEAEFEDSQRGFVGKEYTQQRNKTISLVRIDPTVLMRDGMTGPKLENALSLSPEPEIRAFLRRNEYDLVVFYDSHSVNFPRDTPPSPLSRAWKIIYENEIAKSLKRCPVLLTGGYTAWLEYIHMRERWHANGHSSRPYNPKSSVDPTSRVRSNGINGNSVDLSAKRANRDVHVYQPAHYAKNIHDFNNGPQSMTGESSYTGRHQSVPSRQIASPTSSRHAPSNSISSYAPGQSTIAAPPQASIHPGPGARRRSDYVEQHNQPYSGYTSQIPQINGRSSIDYPQAHALTLPPPPAAATHALERESRPAVPRTSSLRGVDVMATNDGDVRYWGDVALGLTGLKNLGNTCYMNSTIQCLSATYPFTRYFLDGRYKKAINVHNPLGTKGNLAHAFAELIGALWQESYAFLSPITFRQSIVTFAQQFSGTDQHDSQEFLSFVLDGLHEDLNRIQRKPVPREMTPEREASLEVLPPEVASENEWNIYKERNDSLIVDLFQGQYRNRLECLTCHKTSTTYDAFMYMSLPVPAGKSGVVLQELIDEFIKSEIMQNEDAWNCPRCKVPRRATKTLTIARLPPVLLIQLKRFSTKNGVFWDKSDTPVVFPIRQLDLTRYVPPRRPTGREDLDDPRTQIGPWKYDLYGVSNHMGTLSSGHYTAFVKASKGWNYCEDSKVSKAQEHDVLTKPAYILFYKRIKA